jgi:predicted transcriptional regulator
METTRPLAKLAMTTNTPPLSCPQAIFSFDDFGSISEKTILSKVLAGKDPNKVSRLPIEDIMDEAFPQVGEDTPLSLFSSLLQVYSAILISKKGKATGIVTKADLPKMIE